MPNKQNTAANDMAELSESSCSDFVRLPTAEYLEILRAERRAVLKTAVKVHARQKRETDELRRQLEDIKSALKDPHRVHMLILRGEIALDPEAARHIFGQSYPNHQHHSDMTTTQGSTEAPADRVPLDRLVRQWLDPRIPIGFQFVWWPIWRKATWSPLIHFTRFRGSGYALMYQWSVMFGPVEIRRWKTREDAEKSILPNVKRSEPDL